MMIAVLVLLAAVQASPSPRALDKGLQSRIDVAQRSTARTASEWDALWRQHAGDRTRPNVDLGTEMVVAVFAGIRPTPGYGVEIVTASIEQGAMVVRYRETQPARGAILTQVITSPYQIVAVPKHDGEVRFEQIKP